MTNRSKLAAVAVLALSNVAAPAFAQVSQAGPATHTPAPAASSMNKIGPAAHRARSRAGTRSYDGAWSVVIETTRGSCPSAVRASLRISGGLLLADDQSYQLNGRVAPGGAVRVTVSAGGQSAGGSGRLSRAGGRGWWRTRSGECSGQWTAERRS